MNDLKKAIFETRRSVRLYKAEQITNDDLHTILAAGTMAASAMNEQAWFFTVIQKKDVIEEIGRLATGNEDSLYYNAPTLIVCFAKKDAIAPVEDCTLAMANMMYAAVACDLSTCWIHCTKQVFNDPQYAGLKKACGVPEGYTCIGSLVVGYQEGEHIPAKPRHQNVFSVIR
ncbi:nitroreductase family protein [Anaerorhabdus sp.]|uniref:nitroreductase family protein n=1 Tax=Anaerorhabdus sp. TaxID=1872524 RepID=UPI002FC5A051